MKSKQWTEINVLIRDQLSFQSWLVIGALAQSALVHFVRPPYAFLPALLSIAYISIRYTLESLGVTARVSSPPVNIGRYTAEPPANVPGGAGVTVFLLGFQSAHPLRLMAPGTKEIGEHFARIFETAEKDPASGLLGRCGPLLDAGGEGGNAMFTISYWKTQELLKAWHAGPAHSEGMKWYYGSRSKYPHLGAYRRHRQPC
jgi:heme-degrading monooxygenase HmoA